jgi:hypothetical protein
MWGVAAAGIVLAGVIGAGVVMAQSDEDGTGVAFLDRVAQKLGISRDTLDQAIEDARMEEIDEAVANGDLTQEQADRLKERLEELPADAPSFGPGFHHKFGARDGFGFGFKFGIDGHGVGFDSEAMAEFLGIEQEQLGDELQADGATLASVAEAHGKARDELIAFILGDLETKLDERVAAGDLTRERADEIAANAREHAEEMIDREFGWRPFPGALKGEFGFAFPGIGFAFVSEELGEFLGVDEETLREELRADGATLASVAEAHGKTRDELKAFLIEGFTAKLNAMVAEDMITQEHADEMIAAHSERLDEVIDSELPNFGGGFRGGVFPFEGGPPPFGGEMIEEEWSEDEIGPADGAPSGTQGSELTPAFRS